MLCLNWYTTGIDAFLYGVRQSSNPAVINMPETCGDICGDDITMVLHKPPLENWGIRGGKPVNAVDLGFTIKV